MESNSIQTKVNKIGRAGKIVSIILIVLLSIGAFGLVVGGVVCAAIPRDLVEVNLLPVVDVAVNMDTIGSDWTDIDEILGEAQTALSEDSSFVRLEKTDRGLLIHVDPGQEEAAVYTLRDALKAICAGLIAIASAIVTLVMLKKLCEAFSLCRTPFDEPVIRRMNTFAWTLIVCAVVGAFAGAAASAALAGFGRMSINLNLTPIFAALIVFFLCMVFRYGAQLQQEADETL